MKFGLSKDTIQKMQGVFTRFPAIEKAVLYGSRAKGNYKTGSDIDLTLYGEKLTSDLLADIAEELDDLLLPYKIDLSIFDELENAKLREHIERVGVVFYERENQSAGKSGWEVKKLGDVCEVIGGGTPSKSNEAFYRGNIPWATVRDMKSKVISNTECSISKEAVSQSSTNIIPKDNVIIATRVGLGKVCLIERDTAINQDLRGIIPKNPKQLIVMYLFWWLKSIAHKIEEEGTGATVQGVKLPFIKSLLIPIPSLPEQQRIVVVLDEAFAAIAKAKENAEKNLQNAREVFESYLQSVFANPDDGWVETTLGEATDAILTGPFGSLLHKSDYVENGIPLVNPAHITEVGIEPDFRKTISKETAQRLSSYIMRKGDIVIGRRGEMGRCALVTEVEDGWLCGTGSFFIKPSDRCDTSYLVRFLRSDNCKKRLEKIAGGAVMPNLSNTDLGNLHFNLPPLQEQKRIVAKLDSLSAETQRLESIYQQKLTDLEELKKSILQKAFAGELHTDRLAA